MQDNSERRRFQRIGFEAEALLSQGEREWTVRVHDLSLKGLLVECPVGGAVQKDLPLQASIRLAADVQVEMEVLPAHEHDGLLGLACQHIDLDSMTHLRRLVELNLGDTSLLERELAALGG
ncbi:PilZ domain-containing protein [Pseudomonas sp. S5(2021)]|jgi:hypothetical protein|uniref:Cyclic diguanosine monophosphate-binding protein n=1 Tax=Stutzerimonas balearica TaxID=74829 RepID=A0A9X7YTT1_9GAMM|nr:PilZ domain-containing protein [Stutzerimonas balearica]MBB60401.1 PilZ domain-containing protein [Pseudomonas sp.]MBZ5755129.1 PilZ domain-containing protein [Pseudomonas sp. S5(2021)]MBC7200286.1 PilZ domain-containing protein [Stutzerimonas balearica]MCF6758717.1 PilZ domain-containing protein [Stutzerimonas balearica]OMG66897.1 PilZ domain-containing protein [Stutzerimonas balearica]